MSANPLLDRYSIKTDEAIIITYKQPWKRVGSAGDAESGKESRPAPGFSDRLIGH